VIPTLDLWHPGAAPRRATRRSRRGVARIPHRQ
jgi:hypothetical protein